jgi:hypothetical protein
MSKRYTRSKNIKEKKVGHDVALYDKKRQAIHVLNETAWFIWESLQESLEFDELFLMMKKIYRTNDEELKKDLEETIVIFLKNGLIDTAG